MSVVKWRVYCTTEGDWSEGYLDEGIQPSACFNNTAHTINTNSYQQESVLSNTNVCIIEESTPTGGHYKSVSYKCTNSPGVNSHDYTFPYPISALCISFNSHDSNRDNTLEVLVGPNTTIGAITSSVSPSNTVLTVSSTVLTYIKLGFFVNLLDNTNNDNLGRVISIDKNNSTITIETPTVHSFAPGSLIKISVKVIDNFTFGYAGRYSLGDSKIGGSHVPSGTIIRMIYTNNSNATTYFYPIIEYLY